jgi:hypothetical protein
MTWTPTTYETIGDRNAGTLVGGWMVRRSDATGNTRERADSIFVPMKWTPEPPKAITDLVDALNAGEVLLQKARAAMHDALNALDGLAA